MAIRIRGVAWASMGVANRIRGCRMGQHGCVVQDGDRCIGLDGRNEQNEGVSHGPAWV